MRTAVLSRILTTPILFCEGTYTKLQTVKIFDKHNTIKSIFSYCTYDFYCPFIFFIQHSNILITKIKIQAKSNNYTIKINQNEILNAITSNITFQNHISICNTHYLYGKIIHLTK